MSAHDVRTLVETYAQAADECDGDRAASVFTPDAVLTIYLEPSAVEPTAVRRGRDEISAALSTLDRYDSTAHVIANHTSDLGDDAGSARTWCVAHHFFQGLDRVLVIRYEDDVVRTAEGWRIAARTLRVTAVATQPFTT